METCRRCQAMFEAPPGAPCPRCGTPIESTMKSPMAATTERPAPQGLMTMPSAPPMPPSPVVSAPYPLPPSTSPMSPGAPPSFTPGYGNAQTMMPGSQPAAMVAPQQHPYAQPPPYGYMPQPIQVVVQNQIQAPPVMYPHPYVVPAYPPVPYAKRKDPGVAVLCSFFLPGAGQLYNGQVGKGLAFLVATFVNFILLFVGIGILTGLGTWI